MKGIVVFIIFISLMGCRKSLENEMTNIDTVKINFPAGTQTYLALGDSYTIGEAVAESQSFPYQLAAAMNKQGLQISAPTIIAQTGWTTGELKLAVQAAALTSKFDMVTLLIGVNNQYRGESIDIYRTEFKELLQTAINFAGGQVTHVFVISIPDWGATPFGLASGKGQQNISTAIDAFNAVNFDEATKAGVNYTNITPESRNAASSPGLIAADGLHPSNKMYQDWVSLLSPAVTQIFQVK